MIPNYKNLGILSGKEGDERLIDSGVNLQYKYMFGYLNIQRGVCMYHIL